MKKEQNKKPHASWTLEIELPTTSSMDLRGRQSVRATFRLTEKAIEALSIVSRHMGIKQKSLFDHLVEDPQTLQQVAREVQDSAFHSQERVQKTFVINRRTLSHLEAVSKAFNAPRDALVELSIHRLLPIINRERRKHEQRKQFLKAFAEHLEEGETMIREAGKALGADDPLLVQFSHAMAVYRNACADVEYFVEKCKMIEDF